MADNFRTSLIASWSSHIFSPIDDGRFTMHVCNDHFPAGSDARKEIETAASWYNKVSGANIRIVLSGTSHKEIGDMYPARASRNYFDYVDNSRQGFPCHSAGDTGWSMNTCKYAEPGGWTGSGQVKFFSIAVATSRDHDTNPSATDYPKAENIAHELGHVFGQGHTENWPEADRGFISTMQGNIQQLSAYDHAYLRNLYIGGNVSTKDLVASNVIRTPSGSASGFSNTSWDDANPSELYLSGDDFYDCTTRERPVVNATWFNNGTVNTGGNTVVRYRIGPKGDEAAADKITLLTHMGIMPGGSQDSLSETLTLTRTDLASLAFNTTYRLTFKADPSNTIPELNEKDGDNGEAKDIVLRSSRDNCR